MVPAMQASNNLVWKLEGTCREQLEALNKLQQDMTSVQLANVQRHDDQKLQVEHMVQAYIAATAASKCLSLLHLSE